MILEAIGVISVILALCGALNLVYKHRYISQINTDILTSVFDFVILYRVFILDLYKRWASPRKK